MTDSVQFCTNIVDELDIQRVSKQQNKYSSRTRSSMVTDCTDETTSSESEISESPTRVVQFKTVSVREYNRIVGDHPDCKFGPPMTLGWGYVDKVEPIDIDEYETIKPSLKRKGSMKLMSFARRRILHEEFLIPEKDLFNTQREENMFDDLANKSRSPKQKKKRGSIVKSLRKRLSKVGKCVMPSAEEFEVINLAALEAEAAEEEDQVEEEFTGELLKERWVPSYSDNNDEDTTDDDDDDECYDV